MNNIKNKGIIVGLLYFYIHMITEITCFYALYTLFRLPVSSWIIAITYDALAFLPQSIIGYINDKNENINLGLIGLILLLVGICALYFFPNYLLATLMITCLGNCCTHIAGAEKTLGISNGKMSPVSIFVGGGSFGVVIGKLLAIYNCSIFIIMFLIITAVPFALYAYEIKNETSFEEYKYANKKISKTMIILLASIIVIIRGYVGYGIPTLWKKTILEDVIFYFSMGFGKALGGVLIDCIGIRKTSILSILTSIPFLIFGNEIMFLSLIGVMLFSMTMPVTLALLTSVLNRKRGVAFGITTISLFIGSVPIFFFKIDDFYINVAMIVILSILCIYIALKVENDINVKNS